MLTDEQLERISYAIAMGEDRTRGIDGHAYTELTLCGAVISSELRRRKHGPFTLAEAIASGRPFRRKEWKSFAGRLEDCDDVGYMFFYFHTGPEPAYADDITATDYELGEVHK